MWGSLMRRKGSNASNSQKQKANRTNRLPMFPESKIKRRITRRCYGELTSKLGLSGSSLKDREKLLKVLLKCDSSQLPPSICHCAPGDHGYGCENSEEWALRLVNDNQSSINSFSESNFSENVDYEKISEEYKACKVFALNKVHSVVRYQEHDRFIKDFMRDISRTFSSYNLFKHTNILAKFLNVVLAIHQKYPDMDYVQGLNFIVASLSLHCNEAMAFWLF